MVGGAQVSEFSSLSVRMTVGIDCEVSIPGLKGHPECVDIDRSRGGGFCSTTVQQRSHHCHQMREHGTEQ